MFLPQRSLVGFHHLFCQLQRLLPLTHLTVCECKFSGHPLKSFPYIAEMEYPIVPVPPVQNTGKSPLLRIFSARSQAMDLQSLYCQHATFGLRHK